MAGGEEESWFSFISQRGYEVSTCCMLHAVIALFLRRSGRKLLINPLVQGLRVLWDFAWETLVYSSVPFSSVCIGGDALQLVEAAGHSPILREFSPPSVLEAEQAPDQQGEHIA